MAGLDSLELRVDLELDPEADALELEDSTLDLREELLELDVESVERPASGPPPEGAKSAEVVLGATLIVAAWQGGDYRGRLEGRELGRSR